ncbi:hypothetical protein ACFOOL_07390 [Devosia honganensis]|uniref:Uncharacterized protein n=1 Tax=Devosia honganensis TaxID=1610527 RepID=A0ABV7WZ54_9HYPH
MAEKQNREAVQQTFRQFAWNLAGTLADRRKGPGGKQAGRGRGSKG